MVLALRDLYRQIGEIKAQGKVVSVTLSYLEIYNENLRDLLVERNMGNGGGEGGGSNGEVFLDLREDPVKGPCVAGITEYEVNDSATVMALLQEGNRRRTQEPTAANKESSRSHAVLQIVVQQKEAHGTDMKLGKLSLIDLAGSERAQNTLNKGIRLIEGANINRSLLALGNCITALVQSKGTFVPYRDSKLTRLLKDSLGGSCRTVMLVCISPSAKSFEETVNSLKYGDRAKRIKVAAARNVVSVNYHISEYEALISGLRTEVLSLRNQLEAAGVGAGAAADADADVEASFASPQAKQQQQQTVSSRLAAAGKRVVRGAPSPPPPAAVMATPQGPAAGVQRSSPTQPSPGAHSAAEALRLKQLRDALVFNLQEKVQLRRSLVELQAQDMANATEIGTREALLERWAAGGHTGLVEANGLAVDSEATAERYRREVSEVRHSMASNHTQRSDLTRRAADNDQQGAAIRSELDRLCTTADRKDLVQLEYRVFSLELEKVELEQGQLVIQRVVEQRETEIRKLKLQVKARDKVIAQQCDVMDRHSLAHFSADALADMRQLDAQLEAEARLAPAAPSAPAPAPAAAPGVRMPIWDGYKVKPSPAAPPAATHAHSHDAYSSAAADATARAAAAIAEQPVAAPARPPAFSPNARKLMSMLQPAAPEALQSPTGGVYPRRAMGRAEPFASPPVQQQPQQQRATGATATSSQPAVAAAARMGYGGIGAIPAPSNYGYAGGAKPMGHGAAVTSQPRAARQAASSVAAAAQQAPVAVAGAVLPRQARLAGVRPSPAASEDPRLAGASRAAAMQAQHASVAALANPKAVRMKRNAGDASALPVDGENGYGGRVPVPRNVAAGSGAAGAFANKYPRGARNADAEAAAAGDVSTSFRAANGPSPSALRPSNRAEQHGTADPVYGGPSVIVEDVSWADFDPTVGLEPGSESSVPHATPQNGYASRAKAHADLTSIKSKLQAQATPNPSNESPAVRRYRGVSPVPAA
jgi:kinesin family protein 18/19